MPRFQHDPVATQLAYAGLEGDAGPQTRFFENHGEGLAFQRMLAFARFQIGLEQVGQLEQCEYVGGCQVGQR